MEPLNPILANDAVFFSFLLILSYIVRFSLRLLKPIYLEKAAIVLWSPYCLIKPAWLLWRKKEEGSLRDLVKLHFKRHWESFPYIDWFVESYLDDVPKSYQAFYKNAILTKEFEDDRELMKGYNFINQCKLAIYNSSTVLRDEVLFNEGLVRFLAGMCYALITSILFVALFLKYEPKTLLMIYSGLFVLLALKLRHIRTKEVATIFDSYFFTYNKESNNKTNE